MAERIEILFGLNTPGGPRDIALDGDPDPPQQGEEELGKIGPLWTPYIFQDSTDAAS